MRYFTNNPLERLMMPEATLSASRTRWIKWGTDRNCYLAVNSHPGLVNLFLSQTRKAYAQEQQKTSVRDMLKKLPETTSPKISAKSKAPER